MDHCYACYQPSDGTLRIGNNRIEQVIQVKGCLLRTVQVSDLQNQVYWNGEPVLWQHCPILASEEMPRISFEQDSLKHCPGMMPHLHAALKLEGARGSVWYEFIVFPNIPFIFRQTYVEAYTPIPTIDDAQNVDICSGIEHQYQNQKAEFVCSLDTLDAIPLGMRHLEVEAISLHDKTDQTDVLAERHTTPVYNRGTTEREGNIFRISDYPSGDSVLLIKHSPTKSSALNRKENDLRIVGNRYAVLTGTGIDAANLPKGKVPCYASAIGVGKTDQIWDEFHNYNRAFSENDSNHSLFIMSNTWGDRSQDMAICESFVMQELECAHRLGVNIVQIDDGWQSGITANSLQQIGGVWEGYYRTNEHFWTVNPDRFPNDLYPIVKRAKQYGIEIGLWFSPDSSEEFCNVEKDIETLWGLYQKYGIRHFKLDGVKIRSKLCEMRFIQLLDTLSKRSIGNIRFNLDVTAEDRFGYLYQPQYGTLFVENRYTDFANYYPHNTFRNLWSLASVIPAQRLQMEFLNPRRNEDLYREMPFAPTEYGMDYLFATVLPSNPLAWMELSHLAEEDLRKLESVTVLYQKYASELFDTQVIPIGDCPNGMNFSGYFCRNRASHSGHILLFREESEKADTIFDLPDSLEGAVLTTVYQSTVCHIVARGQHILATIPKIRSFVWLRYEFDDCSKPAISD